MRYRTIASFFAVFMLAGCSAESLGRIDTTETAALSVSRDISESDLKQGKAHFFESNYGLAEKHFRKAVELRDDEDPRRHRGCRAPSSSRSRSCIGSRVE